MSYTSIYGIRPKREQVAIEMISPDFMYTIQNCYEGEVCVMMVGDTSLSLYQKIAEAKGLSVEPWILTELLSKAD